MGGEPPGATSATSATPGGDWVYRRKVKVNQPPVGKTVAVPTGCVGSSTTSPSNHFDPVHLISPLFTNNYIHTFATQVICDATHSSTTTLIPTQRITHLRRLTPNPLCSFNLNLILAAQSIHAAMSSTSSTPAKSASPNGTGVGADTPSPNITPMHDPAHQAKVMKQHKPLGMANRECGGAVRGSG